MSGFSDGTADGVASVVPRVIQTNRASDGSSSAQERRKVTKERKFMVTAAQSMMVYILVRHGYDNTNRRLITQWMTD